TRYNNPAPAARAVARSATTSRNPINRADASLIGRARSARERSAARSTSETGPSALTATLRACPTARAANRVAGLDGTLFATDLDLRANMANVKPTIDLGG